MEILHPRCAGLDVHKDSVVACARVMVGASARHETKTFGTVTSELLALSEWLSSHGCTHVAMEATGIYWKPIWHVLEGDFELVLANAAHIRNVPGRKSDVNDATWIADLAAHGLIRGSFVPPTPIQELRDLTRTRKQLVREVAQHTLRIQKTLEDANIKLSSVLSDLLGQSGRAILGALLEGQDDPKVLAALASTRVHASRREIQEALHGFVREHHRFLIRMHLALIDTLQARIAEVDARIGAALEPFRAAAELLRGIPGFSSIVAQVVLAEIGDDMSRFPSQAHVLSWAGLCPRSDESAGKRRSTRLRHGAPWLKTVLVQAAWCAVRKKDCYFRAQFLRLRGRRGAKKAIIAVAASLLATAYHMLRTGAAYQDLGIHYFDRLDHTRVANRLIRRLQNLGYQVQIQTASAS